LKKGNKEIESDDRDESKKHSGHHLFVDVFCKNKYIGYSKQDKNGIFVEIGNSDVESHVYSRE